jgi:REase_AHJR-like
MGVVEMSDLIRDYKEYIEELRHEYAARGFSILSPDQISQELTFHPDLVVSRDNTITVIEIKSSGRTSKQSVEAMRRKAASLGYGFELKVLPRAPKKSTHSTDTTEVPRLLQEARELFKNGKIDLALLLSWITIEISVRAESVRAQQSYEPVTATEDVIRTAAELELISEEDLLNLRAIAELRNRVVHGFRTELPPDLVQFAINLADEIARRANLFERSP